jgi:hypothetical protein
LTSCRTNPAHLSVEEKKIISGTTEIVIFEQKTDTITYITSPEGLTAIEITTNPGEREWYWVFTDHLGSITTLLRESDGQKFEMSFDAWGNRRDPATWENYSTTFPDFIIDRGFTGHEHLDVFGLINMNPLWRVFSLPTLIYRLRVCLRIIMGMCIA